MIEKLINSKDYKYTELLLKQEGFDLNRPINSFQSKNIDGIVYQQLDDEEFITELLGNIKDLQERVLHLERKLL